MAGDLLASLQLVDEIAGKVTGQLVTVGVDVVTCLAFLPTAGGRCCGRPVLWDVYLAAGDGVITAIVGPNGAGKSTLLKRVLDLVPRVSGSVTSYGKPYRQQRRLVAYVPQRERSIGASCRPASSSRARRSGRPGPTAACNARHPPRSIAPLEAIRQS